MIKEENPIKNEHNNNVQQDKRNTYIFSKRKVEELLIRFAVEYFN